MIRYRKLFDDVQSPARAHDYDAAFDVYSYGDARLIPGVPVKMPTGLVVSVPPGYVIMVLPRSGLATKNAVTVANAPGLVDPGYRGELGVTLLNHGNNDYVVSKGDRIAQLLVIRYGEANIQEGDLHPPPDARGPGGFGSTGT